MITERGERKKFLLENKDLLNGLDSSVGIFLGYRLRDRGLCVQLWAGTHMFPFFTLSISSLGLVKPSTDRGPGEISL
jgi:hypothetical protein